MLIHRSYGLKLWTDIYDCQRANQSVELMFSNCHIALYCLVRQRLYIRPANQRLVFLMFKLHRHDWHLLKILFNLFVLNPYTVELIVVCLNCRLLHINFLSIHIKFGRHIGWVANSLDPDQTPSYWSGSTLFALQRFDNHDPHTKS